MNSSVSADLRLLKTAIAERAKGEGRNATALKRLHVSKAYGVSSKIPRIYKPCLCLIAQGAKQILAGKESYIYSPSHYLLVSAELPLVGQIIQANKDKPYFGLQIELDMREIADLMPVPAVKDNSPAGGAIRQGRVDGSLLAAVARLMRLLDAPQDIAPLAPLILREIYYRLLQGEHGAYLARKAAPDGYAERIAKAADAIKEQFDMPIKVEDLAQSANMSLSSFHAHFKQVTHLSPLQYQKHLRLAEGRRLMLSGGMGAGQAAYMVGYASISQFCREYARFFGKPPKQDIAGLRQAIAERSYSFA